MNAAQHAVRDSACPFCNLLRINAEVALRSEERDRVSDGYLGGLTYIHRRQVHRDSTENGGEFAVYDHIAPVGQAVRNTIRIANRQDGYAGETGARNIPPYPINVPAGSSFTDRTVARQVSAGLTCRSWLGAWPRAGET